MLTILSIRQKCRKVLDKMIQVDMDKYKYSFRIYKCYNHDKDIKDTYCYMILSNYNYKMEDVIHKFLYIYTSTFNEEPELLLVLKSHINVSDTEQIFKLLHAKKHNESSYVYEKNRFLYLNNITETEFITKFNFLYNDTNMHIINREILDEMYSNHIFLDYNKTT